VALLNTWFALLSNGAMPAFTAFKYAQFALAPGQYDDDRALSLAALFIAQFPLCLLGAAFSGVSYIEGPAWKRVLVYVVVVSVIGGLSGLATFAYETELGPIIGWAVAMQLVILMFAGPQPALARPHRRGGEGCAESVHTYRIGRSPRHRGRPRTPELRGQNTRGVCHHVRVERSCLGRRGLLRVTRLERGLCVHGVVRDSSQGVLPATMDRVGHPQHGPVGANGRLAVGMSNIRLALSASRRIRSALLLSESAQR
jgi:hypothetical protein